MPADRRAVTEVRSGGRGSKRRQVFLEGELWRSISADALKELPIRTGDSIDLAWLEGQLAEIEPRLARERALRLLSARERSRADIVGRLEDDGYPTAVARQAAEELASTGLVDDVRFAGMLARHLIVIRDLGRTRALRELLKHGIGEELAHEALDEVSPQADEAQRAHEAALRLKRSNDSVARLAGRLVRRGFAPGASFAASRDVLQDADDEEPVDDL